MSFKKFAAVEMELPRIFLHYGMQCSKRGLVCVHAEHTKHMSDFLEAEMSPRLKSLQPDLNRQKVSHRLLFPFSDEVQLTDQ